MTLPTPELDAAPREGTGREAQLVQWQDIRLSRGQPGFDPGSRRELLGVKTWLSTLEIVNLSVFRMRQ